ncbi:MAG: HEAT repeat domain-containing protein, partial [Anaerolineae bacterium]|nr:HEAT repeat domain-containing protein [Anaerolineae bacterium]
AEILSSLGETAHAPGAPSEYYNFSKPDQFDNATTLLNYLALVTDKVGRIDPRGYPRSANATVPISDIYIPLRLAPFSANTTPERLTRYQTATYRNPELYDPDLPLMIGDLDRRVSLPVQDALDTSPLIFILGDSGSGKTTLLRYLALENARILVENEAEGIEIGSTPDGAITFRLSRPLPLYVDLSSYVEDRLPDEQLPDFILRTLTRDANDDSTAALLSRLIANGQCLILLDGIDQTVTDAHRRLVTSSVAHYGPLWAGQGNRVVVTGRLDAQSVAPLTSQFKRYLLRTLDRGQIGNFLLKWKATLTRAQRPLVSDDDVMKHAVTETMPLVRTITGNPRLMRICNLPLILRMLAGLHVPGHIPAHRVAIYQMVVEELSKEWRLPQRSASHPIVLENEVPLILGELAYWLQSSRPSGTLHERELRRILQRIYRDLHPEANDLRVEEAVDDLIGRARTSSGVLVELAPQRYGFIYHALQEYFAARFIISGYRTAVERVREHLHDPVWYRVITLALSFTALRSRDDVSDLIEAAVLTESGALTGFNTNAPTPFEDLLHRDLFFAAQLLGEGIEVRPEITRRVVTGLLDLWLKGDRESTGRFSYIFNQARRHLANLDGTSASQIALQTILSHLGGMDEFQQAFAVDAATFWKSHLDEAGATLVTYGKDAPPLVRRAIASALGRMETLSRDAYVLLLTFTRDSDERISEASQQTLEGATPIPYDALNMWIEFLHSTSHVRRRLGLRVLQQIGTLPPLVIGELLQLIDDDNPDIRQGAIDVLSGVSYLPDSALTAICRTIADMNPGVRVAAITALSRPVELPAEVVRQLIAWARERDVAIRRAATAALGVSLNQSPDVLEALIERLGDPVDSIRESVVEPLARKGLTEPRVLHMLMHTVSDPIYLVRCAVARAFCQYTNPNEAVRQGLQLLLSDREVIVREAALDTIARLNDPGDELIDYLISLAPIAEHGMGSKAINALSRLRGLPDHALAALVRAMPYHAQYLGEEIVACLKAHVPLPPAVTEDLMDLAILRKVGVRHATHHSTELRAYALEVISTAQDETPAVLQVLLEAATNGESIGVRLAAIHGLSNTRIAWPGVKDTLLSLIKHGPAEVRAAAGIALGRLNYSLADPPMDGPEIMNLCYLLSDLIREQPARASWERETQTQNDLLITLSRVVARARLAPPLLGGGSEYPRSYLEE